MRVCTERCFSMSRFITRFADVVKIPEPTLVPVQLNELVSMCKRFMEGMCNDRNIGLRLECDPEVGMVRMDASLFEQVLVNIIKNAAESIEGDAGENGQQGEIIVRTTAPASVEVVDNGPGISKETEARTLQSLLFHQAERAGNWPGVYPGSFEPSWLHVLPTYLQRWIDPLPYTI